MSFKSPENPFENKDFEISEPIIESKHGKESRISPLELKLNEIETIKTIVKKYGLKNGFIEKNIEERKTPKDLKKISDRLENLKARFSNKEIKKIVEKYPKTLKYRPETFNNYLERLEKNLKDKYNFSEEEFKCLVISEPRIISYSSKLINDRLENLKNYLVEEEIGNIVKKWPVILKYKSERIGKSIEWMRQYAPKINLVDSYKNLIFSVEILEKRRLALELLKYSYKEYPYPLFLGEDKWRKFVDQEMEVIMKKQSKY
ncbi:MAG: hypothetical protein KYQ20_00415 [Candidatus Nealsonbacteria bacterium]|nr:hypothetical protein [Candidatus Nealsonbacteria bacterium]